MDDKRWEKTSGEEPFCQTDWSLCQTFYVDFTGPLLVPRPRLFHVRRTHAVGHVANLVVDFNFSTKDSLYLETVED